MKKFIFTFVLAVAFLGARASWLPSDLSLRLWDYSTMTVVFDGYNYSNPDSYFTARNLAGGNHFIKVYRVTAPAFGHGGFSKLVYSGYVHLKPGTSVNAMITADRRLLVLSEYALNPAPAPFGGHHDNGNHYGYGNGHGNPHNNYGGNNYNAAMGMSAPDFNALCAVVANTSFDDTKLALCRQAVSANYVSSNQVRDLMMLLTFESSRLELAKFAYRNVVDKNRYYVVNSAFTFSSSVDELNRYISQ